MAVTFLQQSHMGRDTLSALSAVGAREEEQQLASQWETLACPYMMHVQPSFSIKTRHREAQIVSQTASLTSFSEIFLNYKILLLPVGTTK